MTIAIVCIASLSALIFVLGMNVSRLRGSAVSQLPTELDDPLFVAIRAHGNATEYVPTLAVLILIVGSRNPAAWMIALFITVTVARYVHAVGILAAGDMAAHGPLRIIGAVVTNLGGLALVIAALLTI